MFILQIIAYILLLYLIVTIVISNNFLDFLSFQYIPKKALLIVQVYVFFDVDSESEVCFWRWPLVLEL